jgi:hypothetical protein
MPEIIHVSGLTNAEFFERYAAPGRVGLFGGPDLINRMINRAQRHLDDEHAWSRWSHAFLFQGRRADGQHWVIESDLDIHKKHIRLGVQENRITKYHPDEKTSALAVLDFGLTPAQVERVVVAALDQVAQRTKYSLREIAGIAWAMKRPDWQPRENILVQDRAFFCSAFVRHVFAEAGVEIVRGIAEKNTAPKHITRTDVPHTQWLMVRGAVPESKVTKLVKRARAWVRLRLRNRTR